MAQQSLEDIRKEMKELLGLVPHWVEHMPDYAIPGFWELMRNVELSDNTVIPKKYKDLIGLAVAGATHCQYCALFHTESAKLAGASDAEIAEAAFMGGFTMLASSFVNAEQIDFKRFKDETRQIVDYVRKQQGKERPTQPPRAQA